MPPLRDYLAPLGDPFWGGFNTKEAYMLRTLFCWLIRFVQASLTHRLKQQNPAIAGLLLCWRRGRDSNPRYAQHVYTLSRRAHSTTLTPLRVIGTQK